MYSTVAKRLLALVIDWLLICGYLIAMALLAFLLYLIFWDRVPDFTAMQTQVIAALTSVVPVVIWFTLKESRIPYATTGKIQMELTVKYRGDALKSALIRNVIKFLPWQIAHMGVIQGFYSNFDSGFGMLMVLVGIFLALTYIMQVVVTPSHRHFPDIIAGARVEKLPE